MRSWTADRVSATTELWARVGPRTRDILFIVLALGIASSQILSADLAPELILDPVLSSTLAAPATASLWWRRSHPELVTITGAVLVALTGIYIVAVIGLFSLAVRRRDRVLVLFATFIAVVVAISTSWRDGLTIDIVAAVAVIILLTVLGGAYIGVRRDLLASLRKQVAQADDERQLRVAQARTAERSRIAREMHDVLAHNVSLIALQAGGLEVNPGGPQQVEQTAHRIGVTARQALVELRQVLGVLREDTSADGADLAPQPTVDDLPALVASSRQAGFEITLDIDDVDPPTTVGRTAYRIVQEGLTNVHKHASGAATRVRVTVTEGELVTVEVHNDADHKATGSLPGAGAGLEGLRERVALLGGSLQYGATSDGGWLVRASLPWPNQTSLERAEVAS